MRNSSSSLYSIHSLGPAVARVGNFENFVHPIHSSAAKHPQLNLIFKTPLPFQCYTVLFFLQYLLSYNDQICVIIVWMILNIKYQTTSWKLIVCTQWLNDQITKKIITNNCDRFCDPVIFVNSKKVSKRRQEILFLSDRNHHDNNFSLSLWVSTKSSVGGLEQTICPSRYLCSFIVFNYESHKLNLF